MKINYVQTIIAIVTSALVAFALYNFNEGENKILLGVGSFLFLSITMIFSIGVTFTKLRSRTNIRVISVIFLTLALISNIIFASINFSILNYVITNGLIFIFYILVSYLIYRVKR